MAHAKAMQQIHSFVTKGALGVRVGQKGQSAHFIWKQAKSAYKIELYGPLGIGASYLKSNGKTVELITAKNKTYTANNAEGLMADVLGWSVPVEGLIYWVRGIQEPGSKAQLNYNNFGFLSQLKQNGWTIRYLSYTQRGHNAFPQRLILTRPNVRIVAVISSWGQ